MLTDLGEFGARLREVRQAKGLNQEDFAALGGVRKNSQVLYEGGKSAPNVEYLYKLRDHGIDLSYLVTGQHDAADRIGAHVTEELRRYAANASNSDELDLVEVHEIDLAYGLGGTYSDVGVESQVLHFPRAWLEGITRTPPAMLTFARGRGDSMQPTLQDGDIVLIDRSVRTIREQDAIWALTLGDIAMIKRVRVKNDRVSLLSDNERIPPDEVHHEEVNVVGRVIFIGRRI